MGEKLITLLYRELWSLIGGRHMPDAEVLRRIGEDGRIPVEFFGMGRWGPLKRRIYWIGYLWGRIREMECDGGRDAEGAVEEAGK